MPIRRLHSLITSTTFVLTLNSCTTSTDSTLIGVGIGGIVGAGAGAVAGQSSGTQREGAAVGLAVGAALGGLMGYLKHKDDVEQKSKVRIGTETSSPILSKPAVERVWVGPRIENNTYIEGHYQFVIKKPSRWSPDSGSDKSTLKGKNK